jgi:hypothetical protein
LWGTLKKTSIGIFGKILSRKGEILISPRLFELAVISFITLITRNVSFKMIIGESDKQISKKVVIKNKVGHDFLVPL